MAIDEMKLKDLLESLKSTISEIDACMGSEETDESAKDDTAEGESETMDKGEMMGKKPSISIAVGMGKKPIKGSGNLF